MLQIECRMKKWFPHQKLNAPWYPAIKDLTYREFVACLKENQIRCQRLAGFPCLEITETDDQSVWIEREEVVSDPEGRHGVFFVFFERDGFRMQKISSANWTGLSKRKVVDC